MEKEVDWIHFEVRFIWWIHVLARFIISDLLHEWPWRMFQKKAYIRITYVKI